MRYGLGALGSRGFFGAFVVFWSFLSSAMGNLLDAVVG
jgi:hypothetical protein